LSSVISRFVLWMSTTGVSPVTVMSPHATDAHVGVHRNDRGAAT
jgi:hypothetical protein